MDAPPPPRHAKVSSFMLPPKDWTKEQLPYGKITSKSPRFPQTKAPAHTPVSIPGMADAIRTRPNSGIGLRATSPRLPPERRLSATVVSTPTPAVTTPASAAFKASSPRFEPVRAKTPDVQVGDHPMPITKVPGGKIATKSPRFPSPKPSAHVHIGPKDWAAEAKKSLPHAAFTAKSPRFPDHQYRGPVSPLNSQNPHHTPRSPARASFVATSPRFEGDWPVKPRH
jgi:hypothetical protein